MKNLVIGYLVLSLIVAVKNLLKMYFEEKDYLSIPAGDDYLYDEGTSPINVLTIVFAPSILIQFIYFELVYRVNKLL